MSDQSQRYPRNEAFDPLFLGFHDWGTWRQGEIAGEPFSATLSDGSPLQAPDSRNFRALSVDTSASARRSSIPSANTTQTLHERPELRASPSVARIPCMRLPDRKYRVMRPRW